MSYNISSWETIKLENLTIPVASIDQIEFAKKTNGQMIGVVQLGERDGLKGIVSDHVLHLSKVNVSGTGSGWDLDKLIALLGHSQGTLIAFLTWEGGDSFSIFEAHDGQISHPNIEIGDMIRELYDLRAKVGVSQ